MAGRTNRAHDARARAREARAEMLRERREQDARIEDAVATALLAIENRADALAQADQEERNLAAALQRLGPDGVTIRDIMTMTGLSEKNATRLVKMRLDAAPTLDNTSDDGPDDGEDDGGNVVTVLPGDRGRQGRTEGREAGSAVG